MESGICALSSQGAGTPEASVAAVRSSVGAPGTWRSQGLSPWAVGQALSGCLGGGGSRGFMYTGEHERCGVGVWKREKGQWPAQAASDSASS